MDLLLPCLFTSYHTTPEHMYTVYYIETSKSLKYKIISSIVLSIYLYVFLYTNRDWPHRWISQELQLSMLRYYRALVNGCSGVIFGVGVQMETYWKNKYKWLCGAKIFGCNRTKNDRKHDIIGYFKVSLPTVVLLWYIVWARCIFQKNWKGSKGKL